jgi:hypothetical protein
MARAAMADFGLEELPVGLVRQAIEAYYSYHPAEVRIGEEALRHQADFREDLLAIVAAGKEAETSARTADASEQETSRAVGTAIDQRARDRVAARQAAVGTDSPADQDRYVELTTPSEFRTELKGDVESILDAQGRPVTVTFEQLTDAWQRLPHPQRLLPPRQLAGWIADMVDPLRTRPRLAGGGQDHSRTARQGTGDTDSDPPQAVFERDLRAIRYMEASEEFERRLAIHILTAQPAVAEEIRVLTRAAWRLVQKHSPQQLVLFGSSDATRPGSVGTKLRVLEDRMLHGNLREHMSMLYHAAFRQAFVEIFKIPRHPVIAELRAERQKTPQTLTWERPKDVQPPLSTAERAFAVRVDDDGREQLLWARGEQYTQLSFNGRLHQQSKTVGGLVSTGVSGSTLGLLQVAKEISAWTGIRVDMRLVRLAAIGVYVGVGHHSMHEVMLAAQVWDEEENGVHGLGYDNDVRRYRRIAPLSEDHLRTHVAPDGVFPDEHLLPTDGYGPLAGPGRTSVTSAAAAARAGQATTSIGTGTHGRRPAVTGPSAATVARPAPAPRYVSVDDARRGFERAEAALTPLGTREQEMLRAAAEIMKSRHQSPHIDHRAMTPEETAYQKLYIDMMRLVTYELLINDGRHDARRRAKAVSEELRALFGTRRTHGAPGGESSPAAKR